MFRDYVEMIEELVRSGGGGGRAGPAVRAPHGAGGAAAACVRRLHGRRPRVPLLRRRALLLSGHARLVSPGARRQGAVATLGLRHGACRKRLGNSVTQHL